MIEMSFRSTWLFASEDFYRWICGPGLGIPE